MGKIKGNNVKGIMVLFLIIGLAVFVGFVCYVVKTIKFALNSTEVTATVVYIDYGHGDDDSDDVYVSYTVDVQIYASKRINAFATFMYEGKEIKVRYNNDNPNNVVWMTSDILVCVFLFVFSAIFLAISLFFIIKEGKKKRIAKRVQETGRKCYAYVVDVVPDFSVTVNGRHPYSRVICKSEERGTVRSYSSESAQIGDAIRIGDQVAVYYDSTDATAYFVDLNDRKEGTGMLPDFEREIREKYEREDDGEVFSGIWSESESTSAVAPTSEEDSSFDGLKIPDDDMFS